ncbi:hypothetical protein PMAYCL1PPCAC_29720, partial [Pristionchus mayeri]
FSLSMTRRVNNENGESFTLFFTMVSPFSNFHPCIFYEGDHCGDKKRFSCVEQFYMYMKAALFDDLDTANEVMRERNPKRMKSLGKGVKGFSQQRWDKLSPQVMEKALLAKFSQNKELRWYLFLSQGSQMVEASPMDNVWGIGLSMDSPDAVNPRRWRGTNRLGKIMTDVREKLLKMNEFSLEAEEALREIALKGPKVFMDLQSDPQSSAFNTPQHGFKRRHADSDPRGDAKRQRTMDDYVSTPNSSSYGSRFGEREAKTEPRTRTYRDDEDIHRMRQERFGSRDTDMRSKNREEKRRESKEEERMRERIARRMVHPPSTGPRFGQPPRSMLDPPPIIHSMTPMGMMNIPPPGYPPHSGHIHNGCHSVSAPPPPLLPPMEFPHPPPPLPANLPSTPLMGVPPPPHMDEKEITPPPPPPPVPLVVEVQAGVVHSAVKKIEENENEEKGEQLVSPSVIPSKKSKIKMNLQKETLLYHSKGKEINPSILSLRKKIQEDEEMLKQEVKEEIKEEVEKEGDDDGGPPKAYAIKSSVQSEKRRRSTRVRNESSSEEEEKKEASRGRRENGERREENNGDKRYSTREKRDHSRDEGRRRRRSSSRDHRDGRNNSREDYRLRDRRGERRDDSRKKDEGMERERSKDRSERKQEDIQREGRRSSVERKEKKRSPKAEDIVDEKNEKKAKKAAKREAKKAKKAAKKKRKEEEEERDGLMGEEKEGPEIPQGESAEDMIVDGKKKDNGDEKKEEGEIEKMEGTKEEEIEKK